MLEKMVRGLFGFLGMGIIFVTWGAFVLGQNQITYVPPTEEQENLSTNSSSATRSCPQDLTNVVTLLAPEDHVGLTTLERPFLFYQIKKKVENQALLTVAEIDGRTALIEEEINLSNPGIRRFQFPKKTVLKSHQKYLWTMTIFCNPKRPSDSIQLQTILERIPPSLSLLNQREKTNSFWEKSELSASSGLWYDTLFYLSFTPSPQSDFQNLMKQINNQ